MCAEFTMPQFEGTTGQEFVALQLALDFEDFDAAAAAKKPAETSGEAPDKSTTNVIPDGPAEPTEEKKATDETKTAEENKKADAAKPAEKPGYSPILDDEVQNVGISNKVHPKTINLIQVLYVKSVSNAMV